MPQSKASRVEAANARRQQRGATARKLAEQSRTIQPPEVKTRKKAGTLDKYNILITYLDEWLEERQGSEVDKQGQPVRNFMQWVDAELPFFTIDLIESFFEFYIASAPGQITDKVQQSTFRRKSMMLMAIWSYHAKEVIRGQRRSQVKELTKHIIHKHQLPHSPRKRAIMDAKSLLALIVGALDRLFRCFPRARLSTITYLALTSQTGMRPMAVLRYRTGKKSMPQGATYGQFRLFALADPSNRCNRLAGFYHAKYDKNQAGQARIYPLPSGPTIITSTIHLVIWSLFVDGGISKESIREALDVSFLTGNDVKEIVIPQEWRKKEVFLSHRGIGITSQIMTERLEDISVHVGFEELVQAYTPRHMVMQALRSARVDIAKIKELATHDTHSNAISHYMRHGVPFNAHSVMANQDLNRNEFRQAAIAVGTRPNPLVPNKLNPAQEAAALRSENVENLRSAYQTALDTWSSDKGDNEKRSAKREAQFKLEYAEKRARKDATTSLRSTFFEVAAEHGWEKAAETSGFTREVALSQAESSFFDIMNAPITDAKIAYEAAFKYHLDSFATWKRKEKRKVAASGKDEEQSDSEYDETEEMSDFTASEDESDTASESSLDSDDDELLPFDA